MFSNEAKAPVRNAYPITLAVFRVMCSQKTNSAGNADPITLSFSQVMSSQGTMPVRGTLTRSPWLFSGHVFPENASPCKERRSRTPWLVLIHYPSSSINHPSPSIIFLHHQSGTIHHALWISQHRFRDQVGINFGSCWHHYGIILIPTNFTNM